MRRHAFVLLASIALLTAGKFEKLEPVEQDQFRALQVFMDKDEVKAFYKKKTPEERNAYLKELGLWDRFYKYDEAERQAMLNGDVRIGYDRDQLYMAWGAPYIKNRLTGRKASRSERLVYRFEVDKDGYATPLGRKADYKAVDRYQVEVTIDDDVVTEIKEKGDWD
jgi:hypothetical protein